MIATVCKSCNTVHRAIIDRCKYCGSQNVHVKSISDQMVTKARSSSREILKEKEKY